MSVRKGQSASARAVRHRPSRNRRLFRSGPRLPGWKQFLYRRLTIGMV
jgi:hypothetical protein